MKPFYNVIVGRGFIAKNLCIQLDRSICISSKEEVQNISKEPMRLIFAHGLSRGSDLIDSQLLSLVEWIKQFDRFKQFIVESVYISSEKVDTDPTAEFSVIKKHCEQIFLSWSKDVGIVLRLPNVLGLFARVRDNSILSKWIHEESRPTPNSNELNVVYVKELASSILESRNFETAKETINDLAKRIVLIKEGQEPKTDFEHLVRSSLLCMSLKNRLKNAERFLQRDAGFLYDNDSNSPIDRQYIFSVKPSMRRGGHYHKTQTEVFTCIFGACLLVIKLNNNSFGYVELNEGKKINILPYELHTIINHCTLSCIIAVSSSQKYIPNSIPDTYTEFE